MANVSDVTSSAEQAGDAERRSAHDALRDAYLKTTYRVLVTPRIDIRIAEGNPVLDQLLRDLGVDQWAIVTASNPGSKALAADENAKRNTQLKRCLQQQRWKFFDAIGLPDHPGWPPEDSVLILGMGRECARSLAEKFGQNAIVHGCLGGIPELVWVVGQY